MAISTLNSKLEPKDFHMHKDVEVRFRDTDMVGHVNNGVYSSYLEMGRIAYFQKLGFDLGADVSTMLVETHIRFLWSAMLGDTVRTYIRAVEMKKLKFAFEYILTRVSDGKKLAVARSVQVGFDAKANRAVAIPTALVEKIHQLESGQID